MGVLYYLAKHDDSRELFALNKPFGYLRWDDADDKSSLPGALGAKPRPLTSVVTDAADFAVKFIRPEFREWGERIGARALAWAGSAPVSFMSENGIEDFHDGMEYDAHIALITGSAHDKDYGADGVTYRPGSAW